MGAKRRVLGGEAKGRGGECAPGSERERERGGHGGRQPRAASVPSRGGSSQ